MKEKHRCKLGTRHILVDHKETSHALSMSLALLSYFIVVNIIYLFFVTSYLYILLSQICK